MKLEEYLDSTGFTKASLARALDISKAAISRWDEIPEKWVSQLDGLKPEPDVPMAEKKKDWNKYTVDEIRAICKRRGGLEGMAEREFETDYEISRSLGLRVWEFNRMVDKLRRNRS